MLKRKTEGGHFVFIGRQGCFGTCSHCTIQLMVLLLLLQVLLLQRFQPVVKGKKAGFLIAEGSLASTEGVSF